MVKVKRNNRLLKNSAYLFFLLVALLGLWQGSKPKLFHSAISPHRVYRIEYYEASFLQGMMHPGYKMPAFAKLYQINPEKLIRKSKVVDLWMNGELYWYTFPPMNKVRVGRDIVFDDIPPECTGCPPLPKSTVMP
jgi:hypothetical protein